MENVVVFLCFFKTTIFFFKFNNNSFNNNIEIPLCSLQKW